ncbi:hypothetical protein Areg01_00750 [Actinoplanes regularis]|nr:hypothetical protein Areg01_00750 [Actinoplanes regularis]
MRVAAGGVIRGGWWLVSLGAYLRVAGGGREGDRRRMVLVSLGAYLRVAGGGREGDQRWTVAGEPRPCPQTAGGGQNGDQKRTVAGEHRQRGCGATHKTAPKINLR